MIAIIKKIISLLNPVQKKVLSILFVFMLIGMLLETLGIGLIIPLFSIITDQNFIEKYPSVAIFLAKLSPENWFLDSSQFKIDQNQLIKSSVIIILLVYLFKSCFLVYVSWKQSDFLKKYGL